MKFFAGNYRTRHPGRLFWKILGGFWLALVVILLANQWTTRLIFDIEKSRAIEEARLEETGSRIATDYEENGPSALTNWKRRLFREKGLRFRLLDEKGQPLDARDQMEHRPPHGPSMPTIPVESASGNRYLLILPPSRYTESLARSVDSYRGWRLTITLALAALASWLLYRHLASPLQVLSDTARELSSGNLEARARSRLHRRRDEFGELADTFDQMAARLADKITQQEQLLRDISHEVRTPLTRQQLSLALLRQKGATPELVNRIERHNQQINTLLGELLDYLRLDSAVIDAADFSECNLPALFEELINEAEPEWALRGLTVNNDCQSGLQLHTNRTLLKRALENLLRNAIEYTHEGTCISMIGRKTPDESQVELSVCDEGPGVEPGHLEQLFQPFYRADKARTDQDEHHGLGLAIAARAARCHGGRIHAENRPSGGLCVTLVLPFTSRGPNNLQQG